MSEVPLYGRAVRVRVLRYVSVVWVLGFAFPPVLNMRSLPSPVRNGSWTGPPQGKRLQSVMLADRITSPLLPAEGTLGALGALNRRYGLLRDRIFMSVQHHVSHTAAEDTLTSTPKRQESWHEYPIAALPAGHFPARMTALGGKQ